MDFINEILDFQSHGDSTIYFIIGAVSTVLFVLRLLASLVFGADTDSDLDMHADADGIDGSTGSFNVISLFSISSFFMGLGWMGVACRYDWNLGSGVTLAASLGVGVALMLLAAALMFGIQRLKHEPQADLQTAVGRTGHVYLTIPGQGAGRGQVEVVVSGMRKIYDAKTRGDTLEAFSTATVLEVDDDGTMIVESTD